MQLHISSLERFIEPEKACISQVKTALAQRNRLVATNRLLPTSCKNQVLNQPSVKLQV